MKAPADEWVVYTVAIVVAAIVIKLVLGAITSRILLSMMAGPIPAEPPAP
jgi:hypothetical protein